MKKEKKTGRNMPTFCTALGRAWLCLMICFTFCFPSVVVGSEADQFLALLPSSTLASLDARYRGSFGSPAKVISFDGNVKYQGSRFVVAQGSRRYKVKVSAVTAPSSAAASPSASARRPVKAPAGLKNFVIFARCVVRSFYIWRFTENDIGDDPIGLGKLSPDPLCPERPEYYLQRATRFSEWFFGI